MQEDYDNSGLQVGSVKSKVTGIYIALDIDLSVVEDAIKNGCNLIVVHHPLLFNAVKVIDVDTYQGKVFKKLLENDIAVYASHTAFDNAEYSIAYTNLKKLGCTNIHRVNEVYIADIQKNTVELVRNLSIITGDENILSTNMHKQVNRIGYINGSGGRMDDILPTLIEQNVDLYISSEFKYSFLQDLVNNDIDVVEINHFNSERVFIEIMNNILAEYKVVKSAINQNPFNKE